MIELLVSLGDCSDVGLSRLLIVVQKTITMIQIIVPIILIVMAAIHLINLIKDPDNKKNISKIRNAFFAAAIVFFIPVIVNALMIALGNDFEVSSCWNYAKELDGNSTYKKPFEERGQRAGLITDPSEYEKGNPKQILNEKAGVKTEKSGNMSYNVYIPPNATTMMPLLMWLHGDNGSGSAAVPLGKNAYSAGYPAIVIAPTSPNLGSKGNPGWFEGGHLGELKTIIEEVCNKYQCDRNNINIGGHSRGAIGTWMMVSANPGYFHAAAPISCCASSGFKPSSFKGMKVWAMRGSGSGAGYSSDDTYGRCMQSAVNQVKPYTRELKYTILPRTTHGEAGGAAINSKEMIKFIFSE